MGFFPSPWCGGMPLNAESRPPPHLPSTFITASAAKTHPGSEVAVFTGLLESKMPAGLLHLSMPP